MEELVILENDEVVTSSLQIAESFEKRHTHVLEAIENDIKKYPPTHEFRRNMYWKSTYQDASGRQNKMYYMNQSGLKSFIDNRRKTPKLQPIIDLYNSMGANTKTMVLHSRFEDSFMNKLKEALNELGIEVEREMQVMCYRVDGYIRKYNLVIEYDESHHKYQQKDDAKRQQQIKKEIGCRFLRLDYKDSDARNIGKVINEIIKEIK